MFVISHQAPRLKTSARFCRGCFGNLRIPPKVTARVMHPYESISLARLSDKFSPKSACDGKTSDQTAGLLLLFATFSFKKKKLSVLSSQRKNAVLCNFYRKKFQTVFNSRKSPWVSMDFFILKVSSRMLFHMQIFSFCSLSAAHMAFLFVLFQNQSDFIKQCGIDMTQTIGYIFMYG